MPKYKEFFNSSWKRDLKFKSDKIKVQKKTKQKTTKNLNKQTKKPQTSSQGKIKKTQQTIFSKVSEIRLKHVFGQGDILRKVLFTDF